MQELINSIVRLSAAATLYSLQQVQNSVSEFDTKESMQSLAQVMDGVTRALISKLDARKKEILDNITETSDEVAGALERDFKEIRHTADEVLDRTMNVTREITHLGIRKPTKHSDVKPMSSVKKAAATPRKAGTKAAATKTPATKAAAKA